MICALDAVTRIHSSLETFRELELKDDNPNATIRKTTERTEGTEQVKGAYEFVFSNITLSIEFFIDEITVNGEYALAKTTSKGSTLIHATGETVTEENRELFILQKENGSWKIDRYIFNKMK